MIQNHAELIEGNIVSYKALLNLLNADFGIDAAHPDLLTFVYQNQKLGIEESHTIRDAILKNPVRDLNTYIVIYAHTLTEQAQNALLKISEEPPRHARIFLVTEFIPHILPTLRSRFSLFDTSKLDLPTAQKMWDEIKAKIESDNAPKLEKGKRASLKVVKKESKGDTLNAESFVASSIDTRLKMVKEIHSALDKETIAISDVWIFVNAVEKAVASKKEKVEVADMKLKLEALNKAQNYMHSPGNSVKMLLEYLAIRI